MIGRGLICHILIAALTFIRIAPTRAAEPMYEGRTASSWLDDFAYGRYPDMDKHRRATVAIRALGTEVLPSLTERLKVPVPLPENLSECDDDYQRVSQTLSAFTALGPAAAPAIPALIERLSPALESARSSLTEVGEVLGNRRATFAALALREIGEKSLEPLIVALSSEKIEIRFGAAMALGNFKRHAQRAVPALIGTLKDQEPDVRWRAARSLGDLRSSADLAVPALAKLLRDDPGVNVRCYAIFALQEFGKEAQTARPELRQAARDEDSALGSYAKEALQKISE
jgi:HEAT repeat protein